MSSTKHVSQAGVEMQPPSKKHRTEPSLVEEITFDSGSRQEYLTGFHKRKLQRAKHAQEIAEKKARAEKIGERRKLREERRADLERHVVEINALLKPETQDDTDGAGVDNTFERTDAWEGTSEPPTVDDEAEYVDEDRYTTVTIEAVGVSKEGLHSTVRERRGNFDDKGKSWDADLASTALKSSPEQDGKRKWTKERPVDRLTGKKRRKKFRYESKAERKVSRVKQRTKNGKQAKARRDN